MNGIRLDRSGGLKFGSAVINNTNGVYLMRVERPSTPTLSKFEVSAPMRDGNLYYEDRYLDKEIIVTIGVYDEDISTRRQIQRDITMALISGEDRLYFNDEPFMFHIGRVYEQVTSNEGDFLTELEFKFLCKPFKYEDTSNNTSWSNITTLTTKLLTNTGNHKAKPIIKVSGTAKSLTIQIHELEFTLADVTTTVYIDVENMNVYTMSGDKKIPVVHMFSGKFPFIPPGNSVIRINGLDFNVTVTVSYLNTYLC